MSTDRSILHVDMDAFYASIEQRDRPELRGQPVIVGGLPQSRGVVSAASYEARRFGVRSAMPSSQAFRLCPRGVFIRPRMPVYAEVGRSLREILRRFTPLVEPLSLDEAFLDVSGSVKLFGAPVEIARRIKREIRDELRLVASVGVAPNKYLAKIASDLEKPDGLTVVASDGIREFLGPLPIRRVWGVGRKTEESLRQLGVTTIGDLQKLSREQLVGAFGERSGDHLFRLAVGEDDRAVVPDQQAVSISHETTFAEDIADRPVLLSVLQELSEQVARRLRRVAARARTVSLKLRYSDFQTVTRSVTLSAATDTTKAIRENAKMLFEMRLPDRPLDVRLIGVGVSQLYKSGTVQKELFADETEEKNRQLDTARDAIAARFGNSSLKPASMLETEPGKGAAKPK